MVALQPGPPRSYPIPTRHGLVTRQEMNQAHVERRICIKLGVKRAKAQSVRPVRVREGEVSSEHDTKTGVFIR